MHESLGLKWRIIIVAILIVTVPIILIGLFTYNVVKTEAYGSMEDALNEEALLVYHMVDNIYAMAESKVGSDLQVARSVMHAQGVPYLDQNDRMEVTATNQITLEQKQVTIPRMKIDGRAVLGDYEAVDQVQSLVGGTATIFQVIPGGLLRISTNVLKEDGSRAVGTYIPSDSPVYQAVMAGTTYHGRAFVVKGWYMTAYEPIRDPAGEIIGVLYVGVDEKEFQEAIFETVSELVVGETGYIWIINDKGDYVLSLKRQRDGENIWDAKDADGELFIQAMVNGAKSLPPGQSGIRYYPWQNLGETSPRMKVASYIRFEGWGWTIGPSSYVEDFTKSLDRMRMITIIICLLAIIVCSAVAYFLSDLMVRHLLRVVDAMTSIGNGDLTKRLEINSGIPEILTLGNGYERMRTSVGELLKGVVSNSNSAVTSAEELSASAEEVNASVEQVSATVQEIAKSAQELSRDAGNASHKSKQTEESSVNGARSASLISEKMGMISGTIRQSSEKVRALAGKSQQIGQIVETINGISSQTNLLALNAAIEAARAGDAGRGFAVVADEVRKLAEESQKATSKITELLGEVQGQIADSVKSMDENTKHVEEGTGAITQALAAFEEIPILVQQLNTSIGHISAISEENAAGAEEVSASVEEVTSAIQQVATAAQQLSHGAGSLKAMLAKFKIA